MKKKTPPQPRNYLVKLALFRKAGVHRKSNKAKRRLEKSKKNYYNEAYYAIVSNLLLTRGRCAGKTPRICIKWQYALLHYHVIRTL
jgi:hypothetical protein